MRSTLFAKRKMAIGQNCIDLTAVVVGKIEDQNAVSFTCSPGLEIWDGFGQGKGCFKGEAEGELRTDGI